MTETNSAVVEEPKGELVLTRVFNAPRELVFKAWTDPKHLAQWWGPRVFTNPVCDVDLRPGGSLFIVMRGPDGTDYPMDGVFLEIVEPERLVFTNNALAADGSYLLEGRTVVMFKDLGGKTELTVDTRVVGKVPFAAQMIKGMEEGWSGSLICLDEFLAQTHEPLVVERQFNAPVSVVWQAITSKEAISKWSFDVSGFEPEVGFEFTFAGGKDDQIFLHHSVVREVIPLKRLSYSWRYEGYEGDSLVTIDLYADGTSTRVKLTHTGIETFPATESFARKNFQAGWTDIIGKYLKEYVESQAAN